MQLPDENQAKSFIPSWTDSLGLMQYFDYDQDIFTFAGGDLLTIAPNDPERWAIGISDGSDGSSTGLRYGWWPNVKNNGLTFSGSGLVWYPLFTYGVIVPYQWYAFIAVPCTIIVHKVRYCGA